MVIENLKESAQTITLNGTDFSFNFKEIEVFLKQCELFMPADGNEFDTMTQIISDQLIDNANSNTSVPELRSQLKFLREVSFLLRSMLTPVDPSEKY